MCGTVEDPLLLPQPFEEISHTADIALRVSGRTREETSSRLVLALGSLLGGGAAGPLAEEIRITAEPAEAALMAIDVLRELLFLFSTRGLMPIRCGTSRFDEQEGAEVVVGMCAYEESLHGGGTDVKAITFHQARFEQTEGRAWMAQAVLDI